MSVPQLAVASVPLLPFGEPPVDLGRDAARDAAGRELSKPSYDRDTPLTTRIIRWILEQIERLLDAATGAFSSGMGIAIIVAVVAALAVVVVLRTGPMARSRARRAPGPVLPEQARTAAQYCAAADDAARRSDWNTAVTERFRAIVTDLEQRGVLDARAGRTADEVARDAGTSLADVADDLRTGATMFDAIRYGGADARADDDSTMRRIDRATAEARPRRAPGPAETLVAPR